MDFNFNFNVERKFNFNGKEYRSLEEMPPDVREKFKQIMGGKLDNVFQVKSTNVTTKIKFNGVEYEDTEAMPPEVLQLYEKVLGAVKPDSISTVETDLAEPSAGEPEKPGLLGTVRPRALDAQYRSDSSLFSRALIVAVLLGVAVFLYYLWHRQ